MGCHASKNKQKQNSDSTTLQLPSTQISEQSRSEQLKNESSSRFLLNPTASPPKSALKQKNSDQRLSIKKVMFSPCFEPKIKEFKEQSVPYQFDLINS